MRKIVDIKTLSKDACFSLGKQDDWATPQFFTEKNPHLRVFCYHYNIGLFLTFLEILLKYCITKYLTYKALPEKLLYSK